MSPKRKCFIKHGKCFIKDRECFRLVIKSWVMCRSPSCSACCAGFPFFFLWPSTVCMSESTCVYMQYILSTKEQKENGDFLTFLVSHWPIPWSIVPMLPIKEGVAGICNLIAKLRQRLITCYLLIMKT